MKKNRIIEKSPTGQKASRATADNVRRLEGIGACNVISGLFSFCVGGVAGRFEKKLRVPNFYTRWDPPRDPVLDTLSPAFFWET